MSVSARIAAWWSAWQWVVILAAALAASLYGNWIQLKRSITAPIRAENKDLREAIATHSRLASERNRDDLALLERLTRIETIAGKHWRAYDKAASKQPLAPNCAPGAERVDAVNRALGPITPGD